MYQSFCIVVVSYKSLNQEKCGTHNRILVALEEKIELRQPNIFLLLLLLPTPSSIQSLLYLNRCAILILLIKV